MKELLSTIRKRIKELPNLREENIKSHIVVKLFLTKLGFEPDNWDYETPIYKDRVDISYKEKDKTIFLVETKALKIGDSPYRDLSCADIKQLLEYINSYTTYVKWGLLTNGVRYILLNNDIKGTMEQKVVFDLSINKNHKYEYWEYLSYYNLFVTENTQYIADIMQYKAYRINDEKFNEISWKTYRSALFDILNFYSKTHPYKSIGKNPTEALSKMEVQDFYSYIKYKIEHNPDNKKLKSKATIKSKYSYLMKFLDVLKENGYIKSHNFSDGRSYNLSVYEETPKQKANNYFDEIRFSEILEFLWKQRNKYRSIVVFLLCGYYGLDRSDVLNLKWSNINFSENKIILDNRILEMNKLIKLCLMNLEKEKRKLRKKTYNVIITLHNGKAAIPNPSTINDIFNSLKKINTNDPIWKMFSPQYVKMNLTSKMFESGYTLEQIVYYLNIDIKHLVNYIPEEIIINQGKKRLCTKFINPKHPFEDVVNEFYIKVSDK